MSFILVALGTLFSIYSIASWLHIHNSKNSFTFVYKWAFWIGAFVWEDLLIFSLLHLIFVIVTFLIQDLRVGLVFITSFWIIRSTGETLYFFLQQFLLPKQYPHDISGHVQNFKPFFGSISDQKSYILLQIIHQSVVVLALSGLIILLKYWELIPRWF